MFGSLVTAIGSIFGASEAARQRKAELAFQRQQAALADYNYRNQVQIRVADAKKAGIHPLAAIGGSFSGGGWQGPSYGSSIMPDYAAMGQDIGRAVDAAASYGQRGENRRILADLAIKSAKLDLQSKELNNAILASQLAKMQQPANPTGLTSSPILPGQANAPAVKQVPNRVTVGVGPGKVREAGSMPSVGFIDTPYGKMPVMSQTAKERLEEDLVGTLYWNLHNRILPAFGYGVLTGGRYNPLTGTYRPRRSKADFRRAFPRRGRNTHYR